MIPRNKVLFHELGPLLLVPVPGQEPGTGVDSGAPAAAADTCSVGGCAEASDAAALRLSTGESLFLLNFGLSSPPCVDCM